MKKKTGPWPVVVMLEGLNLERFLRQAAAQGVRLTKLRRLAPRKLTALVVEEEIAALQELALQGGWKLTCGKRKGIGAVLEWIGTRWILVSLIALAAILLLASSQVVWQVDIENGGAYEAEIRAALSEFGITPPVLRHQVDLGELRERLEWRYPRIAWFECGWRGTTLVVRPVEGVLPKGTQPAEGAWDVVAVRDAVVKTIVTRAGTPAVAAGEIVKAGDVLIKGEERTSDGAARAVAAQGSVMGRVWQGASVRLPAVERQTRYTGNTETVWTIRTPWFDLWRLRPSDFESCDTAVSETAICGIFLPVRLHVEKRMEAEYTTSLRDVKELEAEAYAAARRKLCEKVGAEESLIDIWGNCSMIDAETIVSVAIGEMLVEIGMQVPASGMAAPGAAQ